MNRQRLVIIALSVTLFAITQYVIYEKTTEARNQELVNAYQSGYNKGLSDTATAIYAQTENCHTTTLTIGNLTKTIFDISCLKASQSNSTR